MIHISQGRKASSYGQLYEYITKENELDSVPSHLIFKHNVFGKTKAEIEQEFITNEKNRKLKRKGVNKLYHEWIAFHDKDRDKLSDKILEDFARQYFKIRNENALYVASVHKDKDHVHIHFLVSGTELSGKSLRISRQEFNEVKKAMQEYQIVQYPQLQHSISDFDKTEKNVVNSKEYKIIERKGKSDKIILKEKLESIFSKATSRKEWLESISQSELGLYTRGKTQGVTFNERNYRLNTLGFTEERLTKLDQIEQSLQEINTIRKDNKLEKEPEKLTLENQEEESNTTEETLDPNTQPPQVISNDSPSKISKKNPIELEL